MGISSESGESASVSIVLVMRNEDGGPSYSHNDSEHVTQRSKEVGKRDGSGSGGGGAVGTFSVAGMIPGMIRRISHDQFPTRHTLKIL